MFLRACVAVFVLCAAHAVRAVDVEAVHVSVDNTRIVLGDTKSVDVTISAPDAVAPRLSASTGSLSAPVHAGPGTWTSTFTPPSESFPHVALVTAVVETSSTTAVGFLSLHLWGKGATTVKTKPQSAVTVFIGNESFGPVTADLDGSATVPIVVPPGPERAVAKSVDDVGNESQKTIDLGVRSFNRVALVALDDTVPAGGVARLVALAVDKKGEPLYDARLTSTASSGDVDKNVTGLAPGVYLVEYQPGATKAGKASIEVALADATGSSARVDVEVLVGKPARAELVSSAGDVITADDARNIALEVRVFDAAGNSLPATAASVDVDYGRIDSISASSSSSNTRRVTWVLPAQLRSDALAAGQQIATITAHAGGVAIGQKQLALVAGKPAKLWFDPIESVVADGNNFVELHVRAVDAAGNALVPEDVKVSVEPSDTGVDDRITTGIVDGRLWRARFVPSARDRSDFAVLHASLGSLRVDVQVKLVPRPRARLLVGLGATVASNSGITEAGGDLSLLVRVPGVDGSLHAGFDLAVLQHVAGGEGIDTSTLTDLRAYPLCLAVSWRPLLTPDITLDLGVEGGVVVVDETVSAHTTIGPPVGPLRSVNASGAALANVGAGYRLGPGFLELDVRGGYGIPGFGSLPIGAQAVLGYRFAI
jgi:hypothetical protein